MKTLTPSSLFRRVTQGIGLALAVSAFFNTVPAAQADVNIPSLTWTQRSDWLNVKSAPFNAIGDGVADDTAAIQGALTLAGTCNSGGSAIGTKRTVYLPAGTYKISSTLNWKGTNTPWTYGGYGLQLIGCGRDTTIIWSGTSGGAMFMSNGATATNYIGITWNGNNLAGAGVAHNAWYHAEDPVRHENEAFLNFTVNGTYTSGTYTSGPPYPPAGIITGLRSGNTFTADVPVWNCLFKNCTHGIVVGLERGNDFQFCIEGCEFENCGVGVSGSNNGKFAVFDCHFEGSTLADIYTPGSLCQSVRDCTSHGSKQFFSIPQGWNFGKQSIQDCWVDSWTSTTTAIDLTCDGPYLISDCVFTNPPNTAPPIRINNNYLTCELLQSNNYCSPTCTALIGSTGTAYKVVTVPPGSQGGTVGLLSSATAVFLQSTAPADSANIIDVTGTAYNADSTGVADSTTAIQNAINAAKNANNGSIVYLPCGTYKVSGSLTVTGSNYTVQGSSSASILNWTGTSNGTVISVISPYALSLEQFQIYCPSTVNAIVQSGSAGGDMTYDGIRHMVSANTYDYTGNGVQLVSLPAGARVFLGHLLSPLTVNDCGSAEVFGQYVEFGTLTVKGATKPKTGFMGISNSMEGQGSDPTACDVLVDDNQDLVIGHMYNEHSSHIGDHLRANRGAGTWSGRVTIQGVKQLCESSSFNAITINNYQGRVVYGPTEFEDMSHTTNIVQTGTNAVDLILPGNAFKGTPSFTTTTNCRFIQTQNVYGVGTRGTETFPTDTIPMGGMASIAAGFDHMRQLWAEDLKLIHGIRNTVTNCQFEADTVGSTPASWTVTGGTTTGAGVRNVTVTGTGSPFASGTQSLSFLDTTGTSTGARIGLAQTTPDLPATSPAVFSFDVRVNSTASLNDQIYVRVFCHNPTTALNIFLVSKTTYATYGPATLSLDTWYRIRAVIPAPSLGAQNITLYVTPWTATGPGTTSTYTVAGSLTGPSTYGFNQIYLNDCNPGDKTNVNFDNITLVTNDPLLPH